MYNMYCAASVMCQYHKEVMQGWIPIIFTLICRKTTAKGISPIHEVYIMYMRSKTNIAGVTIILYTILLIN